MIGFLSPLGKFYPCASYEHTYYAEELCEKLYSEETFNGFLAEDYLLAKGWIVFRARDVYNNLNGNITKAQLSFIDDNLQEIVVNDGIKETLSDMLLIDKGLKDSKGGAEQWND